MSLSARLRAKPTHHHLTHPPNCLTTVTMRVAVFSPFTDEDTEAQRGGVACPRSPDVNGLLLLSSRLSALHQSLQPLSCLLLMQEEGTPTALPSKAAMTSAGRLHEHSLQGLGTNGRAPQLLPGTSRHSSIQLPLANLGGESGRGGGSRERGGRQIAKVEPPHRGIQGPLHSHHPTHQAASRRIHSSPNTPYNCMHLCTHWPLSS